MMRRIALVPAALLAAVVLAGCVPEPKIVAPANFSALDASGSATVQIDLGAPLAAGGSLRVKLLAGVDSPPARIVDLGPRLAIAGASASAAIVAGDLAVGRNTLFVSVDRDGDGVAERQLSSSFSWEPGIDVATADRCDFLDPGRCLFPFPNDRFTVPDATTDTGRRIHLDLASMPANNGGVHIAPDEWNRGDGFSPGPKILTLVPNVDLAVTGAAPITDMQKALEPNAPILLIDAQTGARVPLWAERDSQAPTPEKSALTIRPGINLESGRRYIVALRRLEDAGGAPIPPGRAFRIYRDRVPTYVPAVEARRAHMEQLFAELAAAGVAREDLYLAWDFTVRSKRDLSERLVHMRDDAFGSLAGAAPSFTVTKVEEPLNDKILRRVTGTFQVPLYLDRSGNPGSRLVLGPDGLPVRQAGSFTADFVCNIPRAALAADGVTVRPLRGGVYGHGLLGDEGEVNQDQLQNLSNEYGYMFCATKWAGMSEDDYTNVLRIISDLSRFPSLSDRLHQGILNFLFLGRLIVHEHGFSSDPAFQLGASHTPVIDRSDVFYDGNSQGAIAGGAAAAFATDWTQVVLGVAGMNYSTLLRRSVDFNDFLIFIKGNYTDPLDIPLAIALLQLPWDRVETNGHARHITSDTYAGTPPKHVLLHVAFGDHQVANVTAEIEARSIGARVHQPALAPGRHTDVHPLWGIEPLPPGPYDGSALVYWDSGTPAPPTSNQPPSPDEGYGQDPHETPRRQPAARCQKSKFLRTGGAVVNVCGDGPCLAVDPPGPYPAYDCPAD